MGNTIDKLLYIKDTKETIKNALIAAGINIIETDTFRSYANKFSFYDIIKNDENIEAEIKYMSGKISQVNYYKDEVLVRTDVFTYSPVIITEVRTYIITGETITFIHNLLTKTTITS